MTTAYVGMGANLGDRAETLCRAVAELDAHKDVCVKGVSSVYETAPLGVVDQPFFLNAVLRVDADISARGLLDILLEVERRFGRVRRKKWEARPLDLDLLLYGLQVIADDGLRVPHPLMHKRAFVLVPLCDLEPDGRHPVLKQSYRVLAGAIGEEQELRRVQGLSLFPACVRGYSIGRPIHCH